MEVFVQDSSTLILLGLAILLLIALGAIIFLMYQYYTLKTKQSEIARRRAEEQFQEWRKKELENLRMQQLEIARQEMMIQLEKWKAEYEQQIREDAIRRSQSVITGKVTEHLVPFLPDFQYNPKDARFIGSPIDLIIFDGLNDEKVREIVFAEIKTGSSSLIDRERQVRNAVLDGRVKWVEIRPNIKA